MDLDRGLLNSLCCVHLRGAGLSREKPQADATNARITQKTSNLWGDGFGVWGLGFWVWGLGFGVWGLGFRV